MHWLEILSHAVGVLGFLLSLFSLLRRVERVSLKNARVGVYAAPEGALVVFVEFVLVNRSSRPLALLGVDFLCAGSAPDSTLAVPLPDMAASWLRDSRLPLHSISDIPALVPPSSVQKICLSWYSRKSGELPPGLVQACSPHLQAAADATILPRIPSLSTSGTPITLRVNTTRKRHRPCTISAVPIHRPRS